MMIFLSAFSGVILFGIGLFIGMKIGFKMKEDITVKTKINYANGDDTREYAEEIKKKADKGILRKEDLSYAVDDDTEAFEREAKESIFK